MKVDSNDPINIASGLDFISIIVNPPTAEIKLTATFGADNQTALTLSEYNDDHIRTVNRSTLNVTLADAQNGVSFDPSGTKGSGGASIISYTWNFGDKSNKEITQQDTDNNTNNEAITHKFANEGTYRMTLEVLDNRKQTNRLSITVNVGSPTAQIDTSAFSGGPDTKFTFDGSKSRSDSGQITEMNWYIYPSGQTPDDPVSTEETIQYPQAPDELLNPGYYKVKLNVSDTSGSSEDEITIHIFSQPPVAKFSISNPDPFNPAEFYFNAQESYDSDPGQTEQLSSFTWTADEQDCSVPNSLCQIIDNSNPKKPVIKFFKKGTFKLKLSIADPSDPNIKGETEKQIEVDSLLNIQATFSDQDQNNTPSEEKLAYQLVTGQADAYVYLESDNATAYTVDFADGTRESVEVAEDIATTKIKHTYKTAGVFAVQITAFDEDDNDNIVTRQVYVGDGVSPVAVGRIFKNLVEITNPFAAEIQINRDDEMLFNAENSVNVDGTRRLLNYSWQFGDSTGSSKPSAKYRYRTIGTYEAKLTVIDQTTGKEDSTDPIVLKVVSTPPTLQSLTAVPLGDSLVTPVKVQVKAMGVQDDDGRIIQYTWWYVDQDDPSEKQQGTNITTGPSSTLTIETYGDEGEEKTYKFALEIKDNDGNTVAAEDLGVNIPTQKVINGSNKAPIAKFKVDRTSVLVNDPVHFYSESSDPEATKLTFQWDVDGDGRTDSTKSSFEHAYTQEYPKGVAARLTVTDEQGSVSVSDPIKIYVDSQYGQPEASFTFSDPIDKSATFNASQSKASSGLTIEQYNWDFDTSKDTDRDGTKDNDKQQTGVSPTFTFADYITYQVKLTVIDQKGGTDSMVKSIKIPKSNVDADELVSKMTTDPDRNQADGKLHLSKNPIGQCAGQGDGTGATVTFYYQDSQPTSGAYKITNYWLDKNVYFDTDGDGKRDNDKDHASPDPGNWPNVHFCSAWGQIVSKLTVQRPDPNNPGQTQSDSVTVQIVFDDENGQASLLPLPDIINWYALLALTPFVILGLMFIFHKEKNS